MKPLLTFALLTLAIMSQAQTGTQEPSDLIILKFRWEKQQGQMNGGELLDTVRAVESHMPPPNKNEPEKIRNRRDMQERAAELRAGEQDAARSATKASDFYVYLIKIKNVGSKLVKSFAWEYQSSPNIRDATRQFLCVVKTKPNDTKELQVFSPFAPSTVVDVGATGDNSPQRGRLIINKIVYGDSSVWQRTGWDASILSKIGSEKVSSGRCVGL
ncbi:MAG: hypothetical protein ABJC05_05040 [Pyrinomonadaceae bacterium]